MEIFEESRNKRGEKRSNKFTHEYVASEYSRRQIQILSVYLNAVTKNRLKCLVCSHAWEAQFKGLHYYNQGCPKCAGKFIAEGEAERDYLNNGIRLLSEYKKATTYNDLLCLKCGRRWRSRYTLLRTSGAGCPSCSSNRRAGAHRFTQEQVATSYSKEGIRILSKYKGGSLPNNLVCLKCNHTWRDTYVSFRHAKHRCPTCKPIHRSFSGKKIGRGEENCRRIFEKVFRADFIKIFHPEIRNPKTNRPLELDGYSEKLKIAFEFNGPHHYENCKISFITDENFKHTLYKDEIKVRRCQELGIQLIVIPYQTKDIERLIEARLQETVC